MNKLIRTVIASCLLVATASALALAQPRSTAKPTATSKPKKEILTNASIIELAQLGLSETIISEKIRQSECSFDTSLSGLKQLKAAKVSDTLIALMMNPNAKAAAPAPAPPPVSAPAPVAVAKPAPPAPAPAHNNSGLRDSEGRSVPLPPDKGAYLWDGKQLMLLTQSQVPSMGTNVGRNIGAAFNPFMKRQIELQLIGVNAKASFAHSQPIILVSGLGEVIPGIPSYRLLYVKQGGMRKDRRILGTYDYGGFGSVERVDNEILCEIKKVAEGVYAIKPAKPLPDGEYGLVPITKVIDTKADSKSLAPPVWDFGIYAEGKPSPGK